MCSRAVETWFQKETSDVLKDQPSDERLRTGSSVMWHIEPPGARVIDLQFINLVNPSKQSEKSRSAKSEVRAEAGLQHWIAMS